MLFLAVFGGVLADRLPKKTVLQLGQAASLANAAAMAVLVFTGLMSIEWLLINAALQGIVMALMMPARQAMLPELVGLTRMMNAASLNMAGMNSMRLFAPALGWTHRWPLRLRVGLHGDVRPLHPRAHRHVAGDLEARERPRRV